MMKKLFCLVQLIAVCFFVPVLAGARSTTNHAFSAMPGRDNLNTFHNQHSLFAFGDTILLPMTLMDLAVHQAGNNSLLTWKAVREEYSSAYTIERSVDGKTFSEVGSTRGKGREIGMQQFDFTDYGASKLGAKMVFYRLVQLNADNRREYTHVIALTLASTGIFADLFPNPAVDQTNLLISAIHEENLRWNLLDQSSRVVKSGRSKISPSSSRIKLDLKGIQPGIYFLQLNSLSVNRLLKIVKL